MHDSMGKHLGAAAAAAASAAAFALGSALGSRRRRRRGRRAGRALPAACSDGGASTLDCPVCLGELVVPRVVPCGHTLCSACLVALFGHERRPCCPVCRKRIRVGVEGVPVNFAVQGVVEARVAERGAGAWEAYRAAEEEMRVEIESGGDEVSVVTRLRPAWNWFKWSVIIVTEFGAFLVSLKEVLEAGSGRPSRHQRIV